MAKALQFTGGPEVKETAKFVDMFDKFFDCLNVNNFTTGYHNRKDFQQPYRSAADFRLQVCIIYYTNTMCSHNSLYLHNLQWLEEEFLPYLDDWESSVKGRAGFSKLAQKQMLLSPETLLGLQITGMFLQPFTIVLVCNFSTLQHPAHNYIFNL